MNHGSSQEQSLYFRVGQACVHLTLLRLRSKRVITGMFGFIVQRQWQLGWCKAIGGSHGRSLHGITKLRQRDSENFIVKNREEESLISYHIILKAKNEQTKLI